MSSTPEQPSQEGPPDMVRNASTTGAYARLRAYLGLEAQAQPEPDKTPRALALRQIMQAFGEADVNAQRRLSAPQAATEEAGWPEGGHEGAARSLQPEVPPDSQLRDPRDLSPEVQGGAEEVAEHRWQIDGIVEAMRRGRLKADAETGSREDVLSRQVAMSDLLRARAPMSSEQRAAIREANERPFIEDLKGIVTQLTPEARAAFDDVTTSEGLNLYDQLTLARAVRETQFCPPDRRRSAMIALTSMWKNPLASWDAVVQLAGAGRVEGIEGLRKVIEGHGGKVGKSERAVSSFAISAGIMKPGENAKKRAPRSWDLAEIEPKVIAEIEKRRRRKTHQPPI